MSIDAIKSPFGSIGTIKPPAPLSQPQGTDKASGSGESFKDMFTKAIKEVDGLQKEADGKIEGVLLGKPGATPHDAMIALEKADTAFQLMNTLRNRIIRAYEEIMRVQI
jgi:flagellar hook-basal body complex protein FliE